MPRPSYPGAREDVAVVRDGRSGDVEIAVLDYGIGNLRSAQKALERVGADAHLVTRREGVDGAAGVVLPGVGAFGRSAAALEQSGLASAARDAIASGVPFLGICVGFQLLYRGSEESPGTQGLGVLDGTVRRLRATEKVPQMQWNRLDLRAPRGSSELLAGVGDRPWVYFVHSYAPPVATETIATCEYGGHIAAAAEWGPVWGTQFHPEKSGSVGLAILANFVARCRRVRNGGGD
jgi:imidazole glycerol-phosphate synthase subunit HisH